MSCTWRAFSSTSEACWAAREACSLPLAAASARNLRTSCLKDRAGLGLAFMGSEKDGDDGDDDNGVFVMLMLALAVLMLLVLGEGHWAWPWPKALVTLISLGDAHCEITTVEQRASIAVRGMGKGQATVRAGGGQGYGIERDCVARAVVGVESSTTVSYTMTNKPRPTNGGMSTACAAGAAQVTRSLQRRTRIYPAFCAQVKSPL